MALYLGSKINLLEVTKFNENRIKSNAKLKVSATFIALLEIAEFNENIIKTNMVQKTAAIFINLLEITKFNKNKKNSDVVTSNFLNKSFKKWHFSRAE